jgi:hypothetical protein
VFFIYFVHFKKESYKKKSTDFVFVSVMHYI